MIREQQTRSQAAIILIDEQVQEEHELWNQGGDFHKIEYQHHLERDYKGFWTYILWHTGPDAAEETLGWGAVVFPNSLGD